MCTESKGRSSCAAHQQIPLALPLKYIQNPKGYLSPITQLEVTITPGLDLDYCPLTGAPLAPSMPFSTQYPQCPSRTSQTRPFFCSQLYNDSHITQNTIPYNDPQLPKWSTRLPLTSLNGTPTRVPLAGSTLATLAFVADAGSASLCPSMFTPPQPRFWLSAVRTWNSPWVLSLMFGTKLSKNHSAGIMTDWTWRVNISVSSSLRRDNTEGFLDTPWGLGRIEPQLSIVTAHSLMPLRFASFLSLSYLTTPLCFLGSLSKQSTCTWILVSASALGETQSYIVSLLFFKHAKPTSGLLLWPFTLPLMLFSIHLIGSPPCSLGLYSSVTLSDASLTSSPLHSFLTLQPS